MKIVVMDGQGGGIGAAIIKAIRERLGHGVEVLALGTNSIATSRMMKAGANRGATGENAVVRTCATVEWIVGPLSIVLANSMMGEMTPAMASAVSTSPARKILIPLIQEEVTVVGMRSEPLPHLVEEVILILESAQGGPKDV
ncbi:MAG TPA: DUF3842 family protein [Desulfobacterales bacterium]|nr:DUF3842 family protein [Desulfobacterales bacterium]